MIIVLRVFKSKIIILLNKEINEDRNKLVVM